uniref:Uncharacterized protein n=1 Tax=Ditylenchus dipsaci TaxID=166011 RepID=A0A915E1Y9_9BILA
MILSNCCSDWILMSWCIIASLFVQGIWVSVFARVREETHARTGHQRFLDAEDDDEYFTELQKKEAEVEAKKRETFAMLFRLFNYMAESGPSTPWLFLSCFFTLCPEFLCPTTLVKW